MDSTIENIIMCKKALPIQALWKFKKGDFFTTIQQAEKDIKMCLVEDFWLEDDYAQEMIKSGESLGYWVWIPRLDQLLDMIIGNYKQVFSELHRFSLQTNVFASKEQAALGLVMIENYNKIWSDDDWIEYS